ncbi:MAG: hypothetical protein J1E00_07900 [Oscillospiraceae bacterium]|nr:hypothetical protein [Oscillospiraceae bacterium]
MKKILAGILLFALLCSFAGCGLIEKRSPSASADAETSSPEPGSGTEATSGGEETGAASGEESEGDASALPGEPVRETVYEEDGSWYTKESFLDGQGNPVRVDFYRQDGSFWYRREYQYDEGGRVVKQFTDGVVDFRMGYDGKGRPAFEVDYDDDGHLTRYWEFAYGESGGFAESHIDFDYQVGMGYDGGDLAYGTRGDPAASVVDVYFYPDGQVQRIVWYDENGKYDRGKDTFYTPEETPSHGRK